MGALRKRAARVLVPAIAAVPATPSREECVYVPEDPQFRPPTDDSRSSGGGSGQCYPLPLIRCRPAEEGERSNDGLICTSISIVQVCP